MHTSPWNSGVATLLAAACLLLLLCTTAFPKSLHLESGANALRLDPHCEGLVTQWIVDGNTLVEQPASGGTALYELLSHTKLADGSHHIEYAKRAHPDIKLTLTVRPSLAALTFDLTAPPAKGRQTLVKLPLAFHGQQRSRMEIDNTITWDTRHRYTFHVTSAGQFLNPPEFNDWRFLGLDLTGAGGYRFWKQQSSKTSLLPIQEGRLQSFSLFMRDKRKGLKAILNNCPAGEPCLLLFESGDTPSLTLAAEGGTTTSRWNMTLSALAGGELEEAFRPKGAPMPPPPESTTAMANYQPPHYITAGYPFAKGELKASDGIVIDMGGEAPVATQSKPLAFWPDGSVKWSLLTFPLPQKIKQATSSTPVEGATLLFADGSRRSVRSIKPSTEPPPPSMPIERSENGALTVKTGRLEVTFAPGTRWMPALLWDGQAMLGDEAVSLHATFAAPEEKIGGSFLELAGKSVQGEKQIFAASEIDVEEHGPFRTVIRLKGELGTKGALLDTVVRVVLHAGESGLEFRVASIFAIDDPRESGLAQFSLTLPLLELGSVAWMQGEQTTGKSKGGSSSLVQLTPYVAATFEGEGRPEEIPVRNPLGVPLYGVAACKGGEVVAAFRKFAEYAPKGLSLAPTRRGTGGLTFELWPAKAGVMDLRRYSLYGHRSQGESASTQAGWVDKSFYDGFGVYGIARTFECGIRFQKPSDAKEENAASFIANYRYPALLHAGIAEYERTGVILPQGARNGWPRAWAAWENLSRFWLWHQRAYGWYGFWSYGDIRHHFGSGYGWILSPAALKAVLAAPPQERDRLATEERQLDYFPSNDWAFDNGRWGWSNTEGLPGFFLQNHYLRTGSRSVFEAAEAAAFHARDVVIRHAGKHFGLGTRHGVQHWSDGNHEERQTIALEYKTLYFLTGRGEFLDTIRALYEGHYSKSRVNVHAAHSGRLAGLLFHWETTGDPAEGKELARYVQTFCVPEGIAIQPSVSFPGAQVTAPPRDINGGSMFFQTFGGMHSLVEYYSITRDPELKAALIRSAQACLDNPRLRTTYLTRDSTSVKQIHWGALAFAAREADEPAPFQELLHSALTARRKALYQPVTASSRHWSGSTAYLDANIPGCFFWANWATYITSAFPSDTVWKDEFQSAFDTREQHGEPRHANTPSWQDDYADDASLRHYLQQP